MNWNLTETESQRLTTWLKGVSSNVEDTLTRTLPKVEAMGTTTAPLFEAMRYATLEGGKRLRAGLVLAAYELAGGTVRERALQAAAAMEMIHAYSLIQDDMPCMDNDALRRGKPTTHVEYGEMMALMASDGLQTGAYEVLAHEKTHPDANVRLDVIRLFAQASGASGMVAGQVVDMALEGQKTGVSVDDLRLMHHLKTGVNIRACALAGVILATPKDAGIRAALETYATHLGRAYQIWDDVLDVTATAEQLGKTPGKDAKAGKSTYVTLLGLEEAQRLAREEASLALAALEPFGDKATILQLLGRFVVSRGA